MDMVIRILDTEFFVTLNTVTGQLKLVSNYMLEEFISTSTIDLNSHDLQSLVDEFIYVHFSRYEVI